MILVREYWPGCVDISRQRREWLVPTKEDALNIPWVKDDGDVRIEGAFIKKGKFVVALLLNEDGKGYIDDPR